MGQTIDDLFVLLALVVGILSCMMIAGAVVEVFNYLTRPKAKPRRPMATRNANL